MRKKTLDEMIKEWAESITIEDIERINEQVINKIPAPPLSKEDEAFFEYVIRVCGPIIPLTDIPH